MNKQQRIEKIEAELAILKAEVEQEEKANERVFGFIPEAGSGEPYYITDAGAYGVFGSYELCANYANQEKYVGLMFRTEEEAGDYADALNVINELRVCKGVKAFESGGINYAISCDVQANKIEIYQPVFFEVLVSPAFKSEEYAQQALRFLATEDLTGEERFKKACKTLQGIK